MGGQGGAGGNGDHGFERVAAEVAAAAKTGGGVAVQSQEAATLFQINVSDCQLFIDQAVGGTGGSGGQAVGGPKGSGGFHLHRR